MSVAKKEKNKNKNKEVNTIFIQIAAYRDPQLLPTIRDCIKHSKHPERLRFGIAWQHNDNDKWDNLDEFINDPRFKIIDIDYRDSRGVCYARNLVQSLYQNETYTLQLDSHHRFAPNWDDTLVSMLKSLQRKGFPKPLITAYIPSFNPENDPKERVLEPWKMTFDRFIPEGAIFFLPTSFESHELKEPMPARFYSGHFAFSLGKFAKEVRHDPNYYFHGEEINVGVRAFTHGYDLFYPNKVVCWHEYTRRGRTKQWDDDPIWTARNDACHLRNRKLFEMDGLKNDIDFGPYGFGKIRTLFQYEKYSGICFEDRAISQDCISHKIPKMGLIQLSRTRFKKNLCSLFKHCIDIGYDQVPEKDYDLWCVAFKDDLGNDMFRQDVSPEEIENMRKDPDGYYKIWRSFETKKKPTSWLVWPHSIKKGWSDPITGNV